MARENKMTVFFFMVILTALIDEGNLSNNKQQRYWSCSNISQSFDIYLFFLFQFLGFSMKCHDGIKPHKSGRNYTEFEKCGITDKYEERECDNKS